MHYAFTVLIFCITAIPFQIYAAGTSITGNPQLEEEINNLKAADSAWRRNDAEFREMREQSNASDSEISEFAQFVAGLKRKVYEGCETIRQLGGDSIQHGVDCIKIEDTPESDKEDEFSEIKRMATREEKVNLLKKELQELEAQFDGIILKEQTGLRGIVGGGFSGGSWADDAEINSKTPQDFSGGGISSVGGIGQANSEIGPSPEKAEPGAGPGIEKEEIPDFKIENIGDSSDDDVVARQLREAAEVETDPLLKEELWKEYKKYKNSKP